MVKRKRSNSNDYEKRQALDLITERPDLQNFINKAIFSQDLESVHILTSVAEHNINLKRFIVNDILSTRSVILSDESDYFTESEKMVLLNIIKDLLHIIVNRH